MTFWESLQTRLLLGLRKRTTRQLCDATLTRIQVRHASASLTMMHLFTFYLFPGDPEAHAKFQDLSKAYNVLSDDAARARYDELGESGIAEQAQAQFDAMLFFR